MAGATPLWPCGNSLLFGPRSARKRCKYGGFRQPCGHERYFPERQRAPALWTWGCSVRLGRPAHSVRGRMRRTAQRRLPLSLSWRMKAPDLTGRVERVRLHGAAVGCCLTFELRLPARHAALGRQRRMSLRPCCRPRAACLVGSPLERGVRHQLRPPTDRVRHCAPPVPHRRAHLCSTDRCSSAARLW